MTSNAPQPVDDHDRLQPLPPIGRRHRVVESDPVREARLRQMLPTVDRDRRRRLDAARRRLASGAYADPDVWRAIAARMLSGGDATGAS